MHLSSSTAAAARKSLISSSARKMPRKLSGAAILMPFSSSSSSSSSRHCHLFATCLLPPNMHTRRSYSSQNTIQNISNNPSNPLISGSSFSPEIVEKLQESFRSGDVEIKPDGVLYLPEIKYRRILNRAFGPGGWAMVTQGDFIVKDGFVCQQFALYAAGRFISSAWGEQSYDEQKMRFKSLATALEGAKSNGLMRCCKDIGIASQLWDPHYIIEWKKQNVAEVWVTHRVTGKKKKLYRRKDRQPFDYPWQEDKVVEGGGASAEWSASVDIDGNSSTGVASPELDVDQLDMDTETESTPQPTKTTTRAPPAATSAPSQPRKQSFDDDIDLEDDPEILSAAPTKPAPKKTPKKTVEEDFYDSDGEPDMFAGFDAQVEDADEELDFEAPQRRQQEQQQQSTQDSEEPSSGGGGIDLDLNETINFGKYRGKTWGELVKEKSFVNYAKWAEKKMSPGRVRDKIVAAHNYAKQMGYDQDQ